MSIESPTPEELRSMQQSLQNASPSPASASGNPLSAYMRTPQIYIKLPSNGKFWIDGSIDYPESGEVAILPMSTRDELVIKTPDALLNGQAVVDVIEHCVPAVTDAWSMPVVDVDTLLIAIRIASYGEKMEYVSNCPKCNESNEYEIDLKIFLEAPVNIDGYDAVIEHQELKLKLKPMNYRSINAGNQEIFEQQRMFTVLNDAEIEAEEKEKRYNEIFHRLTSLNVKQISGMIEYVELPDGTRITNEAFIDEYIENADRKVFDTLSKHQDSINAGMPDKTLPTVCPDCQHNYTTPFTFDHSSFFESAS
jgi:hypothetical protein